MAVAFADIVTFTRASIARYFDDGAEMQEAAINAPRLDTKRSDSSARGLLIEPARTNDLVRAEALDNAAWTKQAGVSVVADQADGPDGETVLDEYQFSGTGGKRLYQDVAGDPAGLDYSFTVWADGASTPNAATRFQAQRDGASIETWHDAVLTDALTEYTDTVTYDGTTGTTHGLGVQTAGTIAASGDGLGFVQMEAGAFPTSYIPTVASAATRAQDLASVDLSAVPGFSAVEGTLVVGFELGGFDAGDNPRILQLDDGTDAERLLVYIRSTGGTFSAFAESDGDTDREDGAAASAGVHKIALAWDSEGLVISVDGATALAAALPAGGMPTTFDTLRLAADVASGVKESQTWFRTVQLYAARRSNAQLALDSALS